MEASLHGDLRSMEASLRAAIADAITAQTKWMTTVVLTGQRLGTSLSLQPVEPH